MFLRHSSVVTMWEFGICCSPHLECSCNVSKWVDPLYITQGWAHNLSQVLYLIQSAFSTPPWSIICVAHITTWNYAVCLSTWLFLAFPTAKWASLVAQMVRNLPSMRETQVQSLGQEDTLEEEMATHYSILTWRIPQSIGLQRVRHNWVTKTFTAK